MLTRITRLAILGVLLCTSVSCAPYEEPQPRRDRLHFPIGIAMHKGGRYLYVVNSNFDARYNPELGGTVSVIDTVTGKILSQQSPYIPSFGGMIRLNDDHTRAYVTARQGNTLVAFEVSESGDALFCKTQDDAGSNPTACMLQEVPVAKSAPTPIPSDPFGLDVFTVDAMDGKVDVVNMSHVKGTFVSSVSVPHSGVSGATMQTTSAIRSSNVVTRRPGTREMYVGGRNDNRIVVYEPYVNNAGEVEALLFRRNIDLNHTTEIVDVRGIAFEPDGSRMYVVTQIPDALHIFDLVPENPETGQGIQYNLAAVIPMPNDPSDVVLHRVPGTGARVLYVPCYADQTIQVVDPVSGTLLHEIEMDSRPYQMVVDTAADRCQQPGDTCRAFVTLFSDTTDATELCEDAKNGCGSVAVVDLDPASASYHTVTSKIR